jgi:hypothetical protein
MVLLPLQETFTAINMQIKYLVFWAYLAFLVVQVLTFLGVAITPWLIIARSLLVAGGEFLTEYFAYQLDRRWDFARSF